MALDESHLETPYRLSVRWRSDWERFVYLRSSAIGISSFHQTKVLQRLYQWHVFVFRLFWFFYIIRRWHHYRWSL